MCRVVAEVKDVDLLVLLELREQLATVARQGEQTDQSLVLESVGMFYQPWIGPGVVTCQEQYIQVIHAQSIHALLYESRHCGWRA